MPEDDYSWEDEAEIDESSGINRYEDSLPFDSTEEEVKEELEEAVEKEDNDSLDDWDYDSGL